MVSHHPDTTSPCQRPVPSGPILRRTGEALAALILTAALSACAGIEPKEFTADDRCRDCEGGGLFSGPDGAFTIVGSIGDDAGSSGSPAAATAATAETTDSAATGGSAQSGSKQVSQKVSDVPPSSAPDRAAIEQRIDEIIQQMGTLQDELTRLRGRLKQ